MQRCIWEVYLSSYTGPVVWIQAGVHGGMESQLRMSLIREAQVCADPGFWFPVGVVRYVVWLECSSTAPQPSLISAELTPSRNPISIHAEYRKEYIKVASRGATRDSGYQWDQVNMPPSLFSAKKTRTWGHKEKTESGFQKSLSSCLRT